MLAREIAIGFGVTIVFPLLIYYGVSTFTIHLNGMIITKLSYTTPTRRARNAPDARKNRRPTMLHMRRLSGCLAYACSACLRL
jgi:hypothetical protein